MSFGSILLESSRYSGKTVPRTHARKKDYTVDSVPHSVVADFIRTHHYSKGCSNTQVYGHGLFRDGVLVGAASWLPPTKVAAKSVDAENWTRVLSLTRLAIHPDEPTNAASLLLGASIRLIRKDRKWVWGVTYADESQGHKGQIYRATNWQYVGRTGPYPRWVDENGRQVAPKSTKNRTKAEMEALGHVLTGRFYKHKFIIPLS